MLKGPEVHGGSGFGAAKEQDLGIEPTSGATSDKGKAKRIKTRVIEVSEGLSARGVSARSKRASEKKGEGVSGGALLSLEGVGAVRGQPEPTVRAKRR